MAQVFTIHVIRLDTNQGGFMGSESKLDESEVVYRYTEDVDIESGTITYFSRKRAEQICDRVHELIKRNSPDAKISIEVRTVNIPDSQLQKAISQRTKFDKKNQE